MTPNEHVAEAERLLALEVVQNNPTLGIARCYVERAKVHALLAQAGAVVYEEYPTYEPYPGLVTPELKGDIL